MRREEGTAISLAGSARAEAGRSAEEASGPDEAILLTDVHEMAEDYAQVGQERLAKGNLEVAEDHFALARRADPANARHKVANQTMVG